MAGSPDKPQATDPKQRILDTAIRLFAKKGYSGTGMRELAREADVNLAMINYHFGSKQKLLETVFDQFFTRHAALVSAVLDMDGTLEQRLRFGMRRLISGFRENPDLVRVAFAELPYDVPGFADYKAERVKTMVGRMLAVLGPLAAQGPREFVPAMIAPALVSTIAFHFLMRPVLSQVFTTDFDDAFYDDYGDRIVDFFLYGILGTPPASPPKEPQVTE